MPLNELPLNLAGRVYASPMPFGEFDPRGEALTAFKAKKITLIVMLTEDHENLLRSKRDLKNFFIGEGYKVMHIPILDFSVPLKEELEPAVTSAVKKARDGTNVAIHCHAGMGRTGIFAACMAKEHFGLSRTGIMEWVTHKMPWVYWNAEQQQFVMDY